MKQWLWMGLFFSGLACIGQAEPLAAEPVDVNASPQRSSVAGFPFVIPWDDALSGTATDVSFLNDHPAGAEGPIRVEGSHFVASNTGRRMRFLGTNLVARFNFPTAAEADALAAHLAKAGINLVRLHHMDNAWDVAGGSGIWKHDDQKRLVVDEAKLARLDYLVAQLKQRGIYVNLNLKVSKKLTAADGFDERIAKLPWKYQKRVDYFDRRMIDLQKDFARTLLMHVNPHTGMSYAQDPAVVVVEINNENALLGFSSSKPGVGLGRLPNPFKQDLLERWRAWLKQRYQTDMQLKQAWQVGALGASVDSAAPALIAPDTRWVLAKGGSGRARWAAGQSGQPQANRPVAVEVTQGGKAAWHVQLHVPSVALENGKRYTLAFEAKGAASTQVSVAAMQSRGKYKRCGLSETIELSPQWQSHEFAFEARQVDPGFTRLTFNLGGSDVSSKPKVSELQIKNLRLVTGGQAGGLANNESLAKHVAMPQTQFGPRWQDWLRFLVHLEQAYVLEMRSFLQQDLGVQANISCTQISWGGLAGYEREALMDLVDTHVYWQHPHFEGAAYNKKNWTLSSVSMVNGWALGNPGVLDEIAMQRRVGWPFSVSEYDHPAPNVYAAETMPLLGVMACLQDWDAIYSFEYGPYGTQAPTQRINNFFSHGNHPAKWAFYPSMALIYRQGLLSPASDQRVLSLPDQAYLQADHVADAWKAAGAKRDIKAFFTKRWMVDPSAETSGFELHDCVHVSDTDPEQSVSLEPCDAGGVLIALGAQAAVLVGSLGGQDVSAGPLRLAFESGDQPFAVVTAVALDALPLAQSKRVLLTVAKQAENLDMGWNAKRNSVSNQWGRGPVHLQTPTARVILEGSSTRQVFALSPTGQRRQALSVSEANNGIGFEISPQDTTCWYEIVMP